MEVEDGLAGLGATVDHRAPGVQPLLPRHPGRHQQQMPQESLVFRTGLRQLGDGFARNHQHMHRRLGGHVAEGQAEVIGVDLLAGDLPPQDAAEDGVATGGGFAKIRAGGLAGGGGLRAAHGRRGPGDGAGAPVGRRRPLKARSTPAGELQQKGRIALWQGLWRGWHWCGAPLCTLETMLARCGSAGLRGLDALPVTVEVDIGPGLPGLQMVGLADAAVQESRERVRGALRNSGLRVPLTRVVVSLAPADLRKEGPAFDLPIALGVLGASGQLPLERLEGIWSAAELGLDGSLRPVRGVLALAVAARRHGVRALLVAAANAAEARLVEGLCVWGARSLPQALALLADPAQAEPQAAGSGPREEWLGPGGPRDRMALPDLAEVQGQGHGRRALEIAAAGDHHLLLVGPPGTGKTMLARRLASLLPPLEPAEALELTQLHSVAGLLPEGAGLLRRRPFRSPHHSCSATALVGGGVVPRPGELSLAHRGVLFLDELAEFRRMVLEQLRQPLEEGQVWISRARQRCRFPCQATLVGATNPCPCGWWGDPERSCRCGEAERRRYWNRLSGPLLDRIDLQVVMRRCPPAVLAGAYRIAPAAKGRTPRERAPEAQAPEAQAPEEQAPQEPIPEASAPVAERVRLARRRMAQRNPGGCGNGRLPAAGLAAVLRLEPEALDLWERAIAQRHLSARAGGRLLRVARTISDLAGEETVNPQAVAEALTFRSFDGVRSSERTPGDAD